MVFEDVAVPGVHAPIELKTDEGAVEEAAEEIVARLGVLSDPATGAQAPSEHERQPA